MSSSDRGRFLPGAMIAERYRIVGLVGRGGMGEVYRADDLRLGISVALKFLPEAFERDASRLSRFMDEVRVARQVTHPGVCRVHDVGESDGKHFLTMEYVDGEDLGTLLRRIGRLPQDKAVQIARQICAGVAAAHEQGILHRDLKPANVMIDGRGRARITDFGLAGLAEGIEGAEVRAGTPAYMAPEQLDGTGVSVQSDIYSLGLVLYELFTGKAAFEGGTMAELLDRRRTNLPTSPASHVSGLEPAVERAILRCLETDPGDRPASALAVAAAFPGGDPLAVALAAGETPSPEMVAAAGPEGGLRPLAALFAIGFVLAGLLGIAAIAPKLSAHGRLSMTKPMAGLQENAREIIAEFGYDGPVRGRVAQFDFDFPEFQHLNEESVSMLDELARPSQTLVTFHYRQSPGNLTTANFFGAVRATLPPPRPGDVNITLDLRGKLLSLRVRPPEVDFSVDTAAETNWSALFDAAGLDESEFAETEPTVQPTVFADDRRAWSGQLADVTESPAVRIEAAAYRGRPVYFEMFRPFDDQWSAETHAKSEAEGSNVTGVIALIFVLAVAAGAVALALHNFRMGRGDRKGAMRLALFVFTMRLLGWLINGHHVAAASEVLLFVIALSGALLLGAVTWVLYMALEPYVRRLWPEAIVGWSRLLAGRFRDPLVGRDLLVGVSLGVALQVFAVVTIGIAQWQGWSPALPGNQFLGTMRGGRHVFGGLFTTHLTSVALTLGLLLIVLLFRLILRRQWLAATVFVSLIALINLAQVLSGVLGEDPPLVQIVFLSVMGAVNGGILMVLLMRYGLLASVAALLVSDIIKRYPITLEFSAPYVAASLFGMLVIAGYALYGLRTSLAGRPLFRDEVMDGH